MATVAMFSSPISSALYSNSYISFGLPLSRYLSTSASLYGKRNFRKFLVDNKRGSKLYKLSHGLGPPPHDLGVRRVGIVKDDKFIVIPEMIPEIIVPDLTNFNLKAYVSYRVPDVVQSEFTAKDLFDACYADKILEDFKKDKLDENGYSFEPSLEENINADEAFIKARKTGSDMFYEKLNIDPI